MYHKTNIRCSYCDTPYALDKKMGEPMKLCEIIEQVRKIGNNRVTITGGEPLFNSNIYWLIESLANRGYKVNVETNGTIPIIQSMPFYRGQNSAYHKTEWIVKGKNSLWIWA